MNCILCDNSIDDAQGSERCCFHPGKCSFVFTTGADDGRYDSDMGYRDVYSWSCCGKREPSRLGPADEQPPLRSPGCCEAPSHRFQASVLIVASPSLHPFVTSSLPILRASGFLPKLCALADVSISRVESNEALVFLLNEANHAAAIQLTQSVRDTLPHFPIVVFSEPDRIDGWKLQADTLLNISEQRLVDALKASVRSYYIPKDAWHPRAFVSYTRRDAKLIERYVWNFSRFERACWFDENILISGVEWSTEIVHGIEASDLFVLVLSPNTPEYSYCWLELTIARRAKRTVFVIPYEDSQAKLLRRDEFRNTNWHRHLLAPRFHDPVSVMADNLSRWP